jgi:hypothetical protein
LNNLQSGNFPLFKLSIDVITLLPKKEDASRIEQYKLIYLPIVSFIFMIVGTNSVTAIVHSVVRPTHATSILGRHILEGVVVLHESIHELK